MKIEFKNKEYNFEGKTLSEFRSFQNNIFESEGFSLKDQKEWRKITKELKDSLDDSKEMQEWKDGLNDHIETRPRETYQDRFQKFHYEVTEHDGGVLGYRRI